VTAKPVKVLSIVGMTRSGSTLLDNLLGQLDSFFSAGELHYLWQRGLIEGRRCGCGVAVSECVLWSRVTELVSEELGSSRSNPSQIGMWQDKAVRVRHTYSLLRNKPTHKMTHGILQSYVDVLSALYRSLSEVTGARVVVDSSKRPSDAAVLRMVPHVEPYFVHLVRDPRAVAHSWRRRKPELDQKWRTEMPRHGPWHSTLRWVGLNLVAEMAARRAVGGSYITLRYEDFISNPAETLATIVRFVGEAPTSSSFLSNSGATLEGNHSVAGNPSRFIRGHVSLREDDEWRHHQTKSDWLVSSVLAWPLLRRYGYKFRSNSTEWRLRPGDDLGGRENA
jgi:hypothetical protein